MTYKEAYDKFNKNCTLREFKIALCDECRNTGCTIEVALERMLKWYANNHDISKLPLRYLLINYRRAYLWVKTLEKNI